MDPTARGTHAGALRAVVDKPISAQAVEALERYVDLLRTAGIERGLIGPREADRLWGRHILNSAAVAPLLPPATSAADLGSGAGLPGIVLAILRPDISWTLIEPLLRRVDFLAEAVSALGLSRNVTVVRARAETYEGTKFDVVLARAVAPLDRLCGWALPLLKPEGTLLAVKGKQAEQEVEQHRAAMQRAGACKIDVVRRAGDGSAEGVTVVRVRKR